MQPRRIIIQGAERDGAFPLLDFPSPGSAIMLHLARRLIHRAFPSKSLPRQFPAGVLLSSTDKLEEEKLPWYSQDLFYPVKIGDVIRSRYQVIGKFGYGGYSTVWLCKD